MSIELFKHIYFRLPIVLRLLITIFIIMIFFGAVIHLIEPEQFPSIFDGIWWAFVTGATVGYGDYVPLTVLGKTTGILLILSGGGLLTFYITTLSAATIKHERNLSKGEIAFKGKNHIIFIGWNERTKQLVEMAIKHNPSIDIVLIDRSLHHLSYQEFPVHFIHGDPCEDITLKHANIATAKCVVISADVSKKERQADNDTILTTVTVRGNHKQLPIIAEVLAHSQVENALRAGANTIIRSNDFMSLLFYHELFHEKSAQPFETILQLLAHQQFSQTDLPEQWIDRPVHEIADGFFKKQHIFLGIIRDDIWKINPSPDFILKEDDIVLTLSPW